MTNEQLLEDFPRLTSDDLLACYDYVTDERMVPRRPPVVITDGQEISPIDR